MTKRTEIGLAVDGGGQVGRMRARLARDLAINLSAKRGEEVAYLVSAEELMAG